jgi:cell division protein FtsQ
MPKPVSPPKPKVSWRLWLRVAAWSLVAAGAAFGARQANSFLLSDPHFTLSSLEIRGAVYTNRARLQNVFLSDSGHSVFRIPLDERRRHLLAVDWVNNASILRVWPNRIVVTITERRPVAFAKLPMAGTLRYRIGLVDSDGVLLSLPPRVRFRLPVLSGIAEEQPEAERAMRVHAMQHLLDDLGPRAKDISEINAANTQDMCVIAEVDHRPLELWIGDQHYRSRYLNFLDHYEEIHKHSEQANIFDLRLDDRILANK